MGRPLEPSQLAADMIAEQVRRYRPKGETVLAQRLHAPAVIDTQDGAMPADAGDWVVQDAQGQRSIWPPERFQETYELA